MNVILNFSYIRPSFFEGIARLFDFCGILQIYSDDIFLSETSEVDSTIDLQIIGEDMRIAMQLFANEL